MEIEKIKASKTNSPWEWPGWLPLLFLLNLAVKSLPLLKGIMIHPDAPVYLWSAQSLAAGDINSALQAYPMLFYPFLISLVKQGLGLDWLTAGRAISLAASSLAIIPFWYLAKKFCSGWTAIFAPMFFIFLPYYNKIAFAVLRDPLYICLALWAVYLASRLMERKLKEFVLLAVLVLILPLLRVEGLVVSITIIIWGLFFVFPGCKARTKIICGTVTLVLLGSVAIALQQSAIIGEIIRFPQVKIFIERINSFPPGASYYLNIIDGLAHTHVRGFGNNFWQVIYRNWLAVFCLGMFAMFTELLGLPLIIAGAIGAWRIMKADKSGWLLISVFLTCQLLIFYKYLHTGSIEERIMLFPAFIWLLFAGAALEPLSKWLGKFKIIHWRRATIVFCLGLLLLIPLIKETIDNKYRVHVPVLRESCHWLKDNILPEDRDWLIWGNVRRIAWFLDRREAKISSSQKAKKILKFLGRDKKAKMVVYILNKRNKADIALKEKLLKSSFNVKFFPGEPKSRFFVVAAWNKATLPND